MLLATPVEGYIACCEALSRLDQRDLLPRIKAPTLVIAGRQDISTPVEASIFIRSHEKPTKTKELRGRITIGFLG